MIKKRIITLLLSLIMCVLLLPIATSAEELNIQNTSETIAETFLDSFGTDLYIDYSTPLYDGDDEINGYWFHLKNENARGYLIVFNWKGTLKVTEFSFDSDLDLNLQKKIYYNGLMSYFYGSENEAKVTEAESNTNTQKYSLYCAPDLDLEKTNEYITKMSISNNSLISPMAYTTKVAHINGVTKINQYSVNSSERSKLCTQTATAMLVQHYKENVSGYSSIASTTGTSLVLSIRNYMGIGSNGTTLAQFRSGLTNYLSSKGYSVTITTKDAVDGGYTNLSDNDFNLVYNDILNKKPAIVVIGCGATTASGESFPCMDDEDCSTFLHAVTVIGTYQNSQTGDMYLEVIDPDGGVERTLFWDVEIKPGTDPSAIWALSRVTIS